MQKANQGKNKPEEASLRMQLWRQGEPAVFLEVQSRLERCLRQQARQAHEAYETILTT